jgi:hypothetical protein
VPFNESLHNFCTSVFVANIAHLYLIEMRAHGVTKEVKLGDRLYSRSVDAFWSGLRRCQKQAAMYQGKIRGNVV